MSKEIYVYNQEDLIKVLSSKPHKIILSSKPDRIIIVGEYAKQIVDVMKNHLSENETLGVELGSHGILTILIYAIEYIRDLFSKEDKESLYIDRKLKVYKVESIDNEQLVLKLKQLDY